MVEKKEIESIFSKELQLIKNQELKNKVIKVWKEASDRGKWESLDNVPFTLLFENSGKLTDHTKRITKLAKSILDNREEKLNQDYLIAGALLHDVGKLLEYKYVNGKYVKSEFGKKFRHPVSGALLAKELGLPDEVVFIIYAHSHEGDELKRSPEAIIINHCDFIDFEIKKSMV
ncbi:MAG: HDIG domain-containing protein [Candidatus Thermoplasmatota archaeon]|jgi:putative nucleotidyltransferase with HDIG domain|nr:HDIG domain-containing protein [Candidatus Thermoplasmatota archaeon]